MGSLHVRGYDWKLWLAKEEETGLGFELCIEFWGWWSPDVYGALHRFSILNPKSREQDCQIYNR